MKTSVTKSITKLSLVLLTAAAFAAFPACAQSDATTTNAAPAAPRARAPGFNGTISAIDATAMTITLKSNRPNIPDVTVKVTSDTRITKDRQPAVFGDAKEGLRVRGNGKKQDDGTWVATSISISTKVPRTPPPAATPSTGSDQK
jgi:hypothetical protein